MVNPDDLEYSTATVTATATATAMETSTITVVGATSTIATDPNSGYDCSVPTIGLAVGLGVPLAIALVGLAITIFQRPRHRGPQRRSGGATDIRGGIALNSLK